jgi:HAD superfamily hydrolase (TIGR01490 family)
LKVVFADVDSTLIKGSSEKSFFLHLFERGSLRSEGIVQFFLGYFTHPLATIVRGPGWNRRYLQGLDAGLARDLAVEFSRDSLVPRIRQVVASELAGLRGEGARLILLSAALEWLVEPLGKAVGADRVIGSRPESRHGVLTGRLEGPRPFGEDKFLIVEAVCEREGISPSDCIAYGDSWADRHIMEYCGSAVAVGPGAKLARLARERGWRIIGASG